MGDTDKIRAEGATTRKLSGKWTVKINSGKELWLYRRCKKLSGKKTEG